MAPKKKNDSTLDLTIVAKIEPTLETINYKNKKWTHPELNRTPLAYCNMLSERDKPSTPCAPYSTTMRILHTQKQGGPCVHTSHCYCPSFRTHPFRVPEFTADAGWDNK